MTNFVDRLSEGHVREWYKKHTHPIIVNNMATSLESEGYKLDPESGLFTRPLFGVTLPYTLTDIAITRPTDFHYHEDVNESVKVLRGRGALISDLGSQRYRESLEKGFEGLLPTRQAHAFRPNKDTYLELRVVCHGVLDPKREICLIRFDRVPEWIEYFSNSN